MGLEQIILLVQIEEREGDLGSMEKLKKCYLHPVIVMMWVMMEGHLWMREGRDSSIPFVS